VNDVLDLARLDAGKLPFQPRLVAVRPWLADVLQPLGWLAEQRRLVLTADVAFDVPVQIVVDPDRLRQVVVNLVTNAVKFTEEGTVAVLVSAEPDGGMLLSVIDTGPGIPADLQATIFDAFTQLEPTAPGRMRGSGLGLSIARRLTEMMGGRIWVESDPGHGSRFHVTIPATPPADAADRAPAAHVA
jgi:signal transduction histidine kinase